MKNKLKTVVAVALLAFGAQQAKAVDITIYDGWGTGSGADQEDEENEPPASYSNTYDLEAFVIKGTKLYMIGEYDFVNNTSYPSGDIFINKSGGYGAGPAVFNQFELNSNGYNYEYVIDLNFAGLGYAIRPLSSDSVVQNVVFNVTGPSNPWRYAWEKNGANPATPGAVAGSIISGSIVYTTGVSAAQIALDYGVIVAGASHNVVEVDLGAFYNANDTLHFTMSCGNDLLVGGSGLLVPDGGMTLSMLGLGIGALALAARRRE